MSEKDMINKVILIGNVGADPEIRTLESGVKMARLRVATTERIYNREAQESRDHTEWHSVVLCRNLADVADRFVHKGSQVYIEGRLRSREWTDQQGVKRYSIEILADDLKLLGRRSDNPSAGQSQGQGGQHHGGQQYGGGYAQPQQGQQYGGGYGQSQGGQQYGGYNGGQGYQPQQQPTAPEVNINDDPDDLPF